MTGYYLKNLFKNYKLSIPIILTICIEILLIFQASYEFGNFGLTKEFSEKYKCIYFSAITFYSLTFVYSPINIYINILQHDFFHNEQIVSRFSSRIKWLCKNIKLSFAATFIYNLIVFAIVIIGMCISDISFLKDTNFIINIVLQQVHVFLGMFLLSIVVSTIYSTIKMKILAFAAAYSIVALDYVSNFLASLKFHLLIPWMLCFYNQKRLVFGVFEFIYLTIAILVLIIISLHIIKKTEFIEKERSD